MRLAVLISAAATVGFSESGADYAVQLSVSIQRDPDAFVLLWPDHINPASAGYSIHMRTSAQAAWGDPIGDQAAVAVHEDGRRSFYYPGVERGKIHEFRVAKRLNITSPDGKPHLAYGYVCAAIEAPLAEWRGVVILVIERSVVGPLIHEIARLEQDLIGDGWTVVREVVGAEDSVVNVKSRIRQAYESHLPAVKAVYLLGHVPVPYSGNFQPSPPDGHTALGDDHRGAWPADVYYADMDGVWTDHVERYVNGNSARATNVPFDGKFDQSYLPSDTELEIGRVDLYALPGAAAKQPFPEQLALLKSYLDKNHAYRHAKLPVQRKALLGDSGDSSGGRAYVASAYRNFSPLLGVENIDVVDTSLERPASERWVNLLAAKSYLWTFGVGGGSNTSISGLGHHAAYNTLTSVDLVEEATQGVFHLFFGSWFGDWDQPDNLMRTALITKYGLACAWSGRPHLVLHALGLGETLGYGMRVSQNNAGTYENQINTFRRGIHIALMGDPTLRMNPVPPASEPQAVRRGNEVHLSWKRSTADVLGYHVYRAANLDSRFIRVTQDPIVGTDFVDAGGGLESPTYMIRAVILETSASGSYYNASQGVFAQP